MLEADGLAMFRRHGVTVGHAWTVAVGDKAATLAYMCHFDDLSARDQAWENVDRDQDWQATKERHSHGIGPLTSSIEAWWAVELNVPSDSNMRGDPIHVTAQRSVLEREVGREGNCDGSGFRILVGPALDLWFHQPISGVDEGTGASAVLGHGVRTIRLRRTPWAPA
jgi:hypothetical protein